MEDLLTKVANILSSLQLQTSQILPAGSPYEEISKNTIPVPPLKLNVPRVDSVVDKLMAVGTPYENALQLSQIHHNSCNELAQQYIELYNDTCHSVSEEVFGGPIDLDLSRMITRVRKLSQRYTLTIASWEEDLMECTRLKVEEREKEQGPSRINRKAFNTTYLPKLEAFFKLNPKPSRADKVYLAKQSGMSVRQINVWFQNHRARVRKENAKSAFSAPIPTLSASSSLEEHRARLKLTEDTELSKLKEHNYNEEYSNDVVSDVETVLDDDISRLRVNSRLSSWSSSSTLVEDDEFSPGDMRHIDPFFRKAPSHAFPTQYPPTLDDIIFPCRFGDFSFPKPRWMRLQSARNEHENDGDVQGLIDAFEKLSLRSTKSESSLVGRLEVSEGSNSATSSVFPFLTSTLPAPVPSFIPGSRVSVHTRSTRQPIFIGDSRSIGRESSGRQEWIGWCDFSSRTCQPSSGAAISHSNLPKKLPPLPKRLPSGLYTKDIPSGYVDEMDTHRSSQKVLPTRRVGTSSTPSGHASLSVPVDLSLFCNIFGSTERTGALHLPETLHTAFAFPAIRSLDRSQIIC